MKISSRILTFRLCVVAGLALPATAWADGAVYAMTNALGTNQVKVYHRAGDGTLSLVQTINTGGGGSGSQLDPTDSLGSQGGLMLDRNHKHLFAVNTNSTATDSGADGTEVGDCNAGSISSFSVSPDGSLTLVQSISSGGFFPDSLTIDPDHDLLYVLNAGGPGNNPVCAHGPNITGFTYDKGGMMTALAGSTQPISPGAKPGTPFNCDGGGPFATAEFQCGNNPPAFPRSPGEVGFTRGGHQLVVTVKGPNAIYVFPVGKDGKPGTPTVTTSQSGPNHPTYFGFAFDQEGNLIVSEPFGATPVIPAAPFSSVSSFAIARKGSLHAISSSVPNGRGTSCWVAISGRYAYIGNNNTSDISSYTIGGDGSLTLLAATAAGGANSPNDLAIAVEESTGTSFLYALGAGNGTVGVWQIHANGSLSFVQSAGGLPPGAGAQGLAAY